jgi:hypothetical protein
LDLDLKTLVLDEGKHIAPEYGMNVLEAITCFKHEKFSDRPKTVSPVITAFLRDWNDVLDGDMRQDLRQFIPAISDSLLTDDVEDYRAWQAADWLARVYAPAWLDAAGLGELAEPLSSFAEVLDPDTARAIFTPLDTAALATARLAKQGAADWSQAGEEAWQTSSPKQWNTAGQGVKNAVKAMAGGVAGAAFVASGAGRRMAARDGVAEVAADVGWDAAYAMAWSVALPIGGGTPGAANAAAREALEPTARKLNRAAFDLLDLMVRTRRIPKIEAPAKRKSEMPDAEEDGEEEE